MKAVAKKWNVGGDVKSPTYVYYKKYGESFVHFDLYRVEDYETFVNIGGEEILDAPGTTAFVEWPDVIATRFSPTVTIRIEKTENPEERKFSIERHRMPE
ncbi:MAG: tRNA threonylcarbamoyladenosine biosynthesis protein TsaE [Patescibacteria group bacterium]|nr:tRNA threonylcarbamoyladenosine biosynthesis protein TsaE [Patescibacteria group bacterium]